MSDKNASVKVAGELFWSSYMAKFNDKFGETNKYEAVVGNLSEKAVQALEGLGIRVKQKEEMGHYIRAKSGFKFEPKTKDGEAINPDSIGNGTKAIVTVGFYEHRKSNEYGNAPSVKSITVTELKTYTPAEEEDVDIPF